jgi:hypothetical protein
MTFIAFPFAALPASHLKESLLRRPSPSRLRELHDLLNAGSLGVGPGSRWLAGVG